MWHHWHSPPCYRRDSEKQRSVQGKERYAKIRYHMVFYKNLSLYMMEGRNFCKDFSFYYNNAIINFFCIAIVDLFLAKIYLISNFLFNSYNPTHKFILSSLRFLQGALEWGSSSEELQELTSMQEIEMQVEVWGIGSEKALFSSEGGIRIWTSVI